MRNRMNIKIVCSPILMTNTCLFHLFRRLPAFVSRISGFCLIVIVCVRCFLPIMASAISDPVERAKLIRHLNAQSRAEDERKEKAKEARRLKKEKDEQLFPFAARPGKLSKRLTEEQREKIRAKMLVKLEFAVPSQIPFDLPLDKVLELHHSQVKRIVTNQRMYGILKDNKTDSKRRRKILEKHDGATMLLMQFDYGRVMALLNLQNRLPHLFTFFSTIEHRVLTFHFQSIGGKARPSKEILIFWNRRIEEYLTHCAEANGQKPECAAEIQEVLYRDRHTGKMRPYSKRDDLFFSKTFEEFVREGGKKL